MKEKQKKNPQIDAGAEKSSRHAHVHTIPVVFFLLTVLSALCRFCEDREIKAHSCGRFKKERLLFPAAWVVFNLRMSRYGLLT